MARSFNGTTDDAVGSSPAVTGYPLTISLMVNLPATNVNAYIAMLVASATGQFGNFAVRYHSGGAAANRILFRVDSNVEGGSFDAVAPDAISANTWYHVCARADHSTSRRIKVNNGTEVTNTTDCTPTNIDQISMGVHREEGVALARNPIRIAEVGIWNVVLDDAEVAALSKGFSPDQIRPGSLKHYWDHIGRVSPEPDHRGAAAITITGTSAFEHCRIIYPRGGRVGAPSAITYLLSLVANATPVGLLMRSTLARRLASSSPVAALLRSTSLLRQAVVSPVAGALRASGKGMIAVGSGVAVLSRLTKKFPLAVSTPTAAVATMKVFLVSLVANAATAAAARRSTSKALVAAAAPAGALQRSVARSLAAVTSPVGSTFRALAKSLGAQASPQGFVTRATSRALSAVTTPAALILRQVVKRLTAAGSTAAAAVRATAKALSGVTTGSAGGTRSTSRRSAATALTAATITIQAVVGLAFLAVTQPTATLRRAIDKVLRATGLIEAFVQRFLQLVGGPDLLLARKVEGLASDVEIHGLASDLEIVGLDIRQDGSVMAVRVDLSFGLGEDWIIRLTARNADGSVMDLTSGNVKFAVGRRGGEDPVVQTDTQSGGVTLIDAPNGVAVIRLRGISQRDLIGAYAGPLAYIIRAIKADGTPSDQVFGDFEIRRTPLGTP